MSVSLPSFATAAAAPAPEAAAASPSRPLAARLHTSLESVAPIWRQLQSDGVLTAYQRLEWVELMVAHLLARRNVQPLFVEIVDTAGGATLMILPFALERHRTHSELRWLALDVCDYAAPVIAAGARIGAPEMALAWQAALRCLPRADLVQISQIRPAIGATPNPLALLPGARRMELQSFGTAIDGDPGTLLKRICAASTLKALNRRWRSVTQSGTPRFVVASSEAEVESIFAAMIEQRRERFREMGRADLLDRPEVEEFYRAAALKGLGGGAARLFGISFDGVWIATSMGLVHDGAFLGNLLSMSSAWTAASPGIKMMSEIMVWAREQRLTYFDLTVGALAYKAGLGGQPQDLLQIAGSLSLRGAAILRARALAVSAKAWLQRHPGLFEPLRNVRRALRRTLGK